MCVCVSLSNNKGVEKNWFTLTDGKYNRKGHKRRNRKISLKSKKYSFITIKKSKRKNRGKRGKK